MARNRVAPAGVDVGNVVVAVVVMVALGFQSVVLSEAAVGAAEVAAAVATLRVLMTERVVEGTSVHLSGI